jgi:hypothetical protein
MAYRLARESGGDNIHRWRVLTNVGHIVVHGNIRPMLRQHALAIRIALAHPRGTEIPGALQP